jgi:hypothetical protein
LGFLQEKIVVTLRAKGGGGRLDGKKTFLGKRRSGVGFFTEMRGLSGVEIVKPW